MIQLATLAILGALAPMLLIGAIGSVFILMTAPLALIYLFAFVALTPISGFVLWRVLPWILLSEALGKFIDKTTHAGRWSFASKWNHASSDGGTSVPAPALAPMFAHLGIRVAGWGMPRHSKATLG